MSNTRVTQLRRTKGFDIADFISRRGLGILLLGGTLFTLLLPLALIKGSFHYETTGTLLLARELPQITRATDEFNIVNYFHDYARTQVERIQGAATIEAALKRLPETVRPVFQPQGQTIAAAVAGLQKRLVVQTIPNTHVLTIKLTGNAGPGLAEMVNAIMDSYLSRLRTEAESKDSRRLNYLTQERQALAREIDLAMTNVAEIIAETKVSPSQEQNNLALQRALNLQQAALLAEQAHETAANELAAARAENEKLRRVPNKVLADEMVANDQALWRTASWTYEKLQELRASIDGISRNNPDRRYIEQRMRAMQEYERKQRQNVSDISGRLVTERREYELTNKIIALEARVRATNSTAVELRAQVQTAVAALEATSQNILKGRNLLDAIQNNKQKLFEMDSRIRDLMVEAKAPLRVSIESYAAAPESPAGGNQKKLVTLSFVVSMVLCAMTFFLYDFTDPRIRSPQSLADALGHPPAWPISYHAQGDSSFDRLTLDAPACTSAKAVRSLAVRINKERRQHAARTAMLTAICNQSGVSSIASNLSHSMTYFCDRVLLLVINTLPESDTTVIRAENCDVSSPERIATWWNTVIHRDAERNVDVLRLAPIMDSEESSRHMPDLMNLLRERYDFIIIDSAPLLFSDTTEMIAMLSDVVIVVVQGDRTLYPDFIRAMDIILRLEVPAVSVALNWGGRQVVSRFDRYLERIPSPTIQKKGRQMLQTLRGLLYRVNMGKNAGMSVIKDKT